MKIGKKLLALSFKLSLIFSNLCNDADVNKCVCFCYLIWLFPMTVHVLFPILRGQCAAVVSYSCRQTRALFTVNLKDK